MTRDIHIYNNNNNNNNNNNDYDDDDNYEYYHLAIKKFCPLLTHFSLIPPSVSSKVFPHSFPTQFVTFNDLEIVSFYTTDC